MNSRITGGDISNLVDPTSVERFGFVAITGCYNEEDKTYAMFFEGEAYEADSANDFKGDPAVRVIGFLSDVLNQRGLYLAHANMIFDDAEVVLKGEPKILGFGDLYGTKRK